MPEEIKTQDAEPEDQWLSDILQAIHRARRRSKGYASFFDWPDKPIKELGIVRDLLDSIETDGGNHGIVKVHHHRPDPPDCVGTSANGERTAFEVTEFVDEKAIVRNKRGENVLKEWGKRELTLKINSIVKNKDSKAYHGGPYSKLALVIHTDEPLLSDIGCNEILREQKFGPCQRITDIWLLFSYVPGRQSYPYLRLSIG